MPGLAGGGGGLSQSWQCQDFDSAYFGNPSLIGCDKHLVVIVLTCVGLKDSITFDSCVTDPLRSLLTSLSSEGTATIAPALAIFGNIWLFGTVVFDRLLTITLAH